MKTLVTNINAQAIVTLTAAGEDAWTEYWRLTNPSGVPNAIRKSSTLPEGRIRMRLWKLMATFGPHLFNGCSIPFVDNKIEVDLFDVPLG